MAVMVSVDQLGAELRRRRKKDQLSLREVEGATGISAATLWRIERGKRPELEIMRKLADWLGIGIYAAGDEPTTVKTDEDLKRTIAVHLRATKKLPEEVARAIVDGFDYVMQLEIQKAQKQGGNKKRE